MVASILSIDYPRLMTWSDRRLTGEQIQNHSFFYGVDWSIIRQIDAPFVPHLRSVTDTSYFPTDDLDQVPDDTPADSGAAGKDLAFLGLVSLVNITCCLNDNCCTATLSSDLQFHNEVENNAGVLFLFITVRLSNRVSTSAKPDF
jgi:hypothetical protein